MGNDEHSFIGTLLAETGVYAELFDVMRVVDVQAGKLIEIRDGKATETGIGCVDAFGTTERCKNCSSIRALYSNEQVVKLEYVAGSVLLIVSAPITVGQRRLVAELVKDITSSMTIDNRDEHRQGEVSVIIDRLNKIATTDQLTGLMNRRYIDEKLPGIIQGALDLKLPVSIAVIDIDFFKKVNDVYGHQAGDSVLSALAGVLQSFIRRDSDFAARYGGEEFMLCFPGTPLAVCREICERVRLMVERYAFASGEKRVPITISIGVAESGELETPTQQELVSLADRRLYQAKSGGRNRVV